MPKNPRYSALEIVRSEGFRTELSRAARISHECQGEGYFLVYLTEDYRLKINKAIAGIKRLNTFNESIPAEERTEAHYDHISPDESSSDFQHEEGKGGHIAQYGRSLIRVHFHPPKGSLIASPGDIATLNNSREQNDNISELITDSDAAAIEYANPIEIVGHIIDNNPDSYQLLGFQEATPKPIDFDRGFMKKAAELLNEISGEEFHPATYKICGFNDNFRDGGEFSQFLNAIGLHRSEIFKVFNGDFSDLERIETLGPLLRKKRLR